MNWKALMIAATLFTGGSVVDASEFHREPCTIDTKELEQRRRPVETLAKRVVEYPNKIIRHCRVGVSEPQLRCTWRF